MCELSQPLSISKITSSQLKQEIFFLSSVVTHQNLCFFLNKTTRFKNVMFSLCRFVKFSPVSSKNSLWHFNIIVKVCQMSLVLQKILNTTGTKLFFWKIKKYTYLIYITRIMFKLGSFYSKVAKIRNLICLIWKVLIAPELGKKLGKFKIYRLLNIVAAAASPQQAFVRNVKTNCRERMDKLKGERWSAA